MKKQLLLIGGNGQLGQAIVKTFANFIPIWTTTSIDFSANAEADNNILIKDITDSKGISKVLESTNSKFDCVFNVAGGWAGEGLESFNLISKTDLMMKQNLYSSLLAGQLAKRFLKENSLFVLTGADAAYKTDKNTFMLSYQLAKQSVHNFAQTLINNPDLLPEGTKVVTILPTTIDTKSNRENMKDADFSTWVKPEDIAIAVKKWGDHGNFPAESFYPF